MKETELKPRRFVEHFYAWHGEMPIEDKINEYADKYNLTIITIAPMYQNGIYVLFEEREEADNEQRETERT